MPLSPKQIEDLKAPLYLANVKERKQAGRPVSYIESWHAESEANRIFGFDGWDSKIKELRLVSEREVTIGKGGQYEKPGWSVSYVCTVAVVVFVDERGPVIREGVGAGHGIDADLGQAHESAVKEAASDAEKRALKTWGNQFGLALYDKTRASVSDGAPDPEPHVSGGRKSSSQAKKDGDDAKIKAEIGALDKPGLADFHAHFDEYTATMPRGWLDPIRDMLENRLLELNGADKVREAEAELDDGFRGTVGVRGAGESRMAAGASQMAAE